jgi:hypothetical protein
MRCAAFACDLDPACSGAVVGLCVVSGVDVTGVDVTGVVGGGVGVSGVVVVGVVVVVCVGCAALVGVVAVAAGVVTVAAEDDVTAEDDDAPVARPAPNSSATVVATSVTRPIPPERPTRRLRSFCQRSTISSWPGIPSWPEANGS